jgi:hypothetical protein
LMGGEWAVRLIVVLLSVAGSLRELLLAMPVMLMFPPMPVKVLPTPEFRKLSVWFLLRDVPNTAWPLPVIQMLLAMSPLLFAEKVFLQSK